MKIRTGFVSNSSSSSYVLIVKEEEYKKFRDELGLTDSDVKNVVDFKVGCGVAVFSFISGEGLCCCDKKIDPLIDKIEKTNHIEAEITDEMEIYLRDTIQKEEEDV